MLIIINIIFSFRTEPAINSRHVYVDIVSLRRFVAPIVILISGLEIEYV